MLVTLFRRPLIRALDKITICLCYLITYMWFFLLAISIILPSIWNSSLLYFSLFLNWVCNAHCLFHVSIVQRIDTVHIFRIKWNRFNNYPSSCEFNTFQYSPIVLLLWLLKLLKNQCNKKRKIQQ